MKNEFARNPSVRMGLEPEHFTDDIWRAVIEIYYETTSGGYVPQEKELETYYYAGLAMENRLGEFRYGSRFSVHSKLYMMWEYVEDTPLLLFDFDANVDKHERDPETKKGREIAAARDDFRRNVDELLIALGVAHPLI